MEKANSLWTYKKKAALAHLPMSIIFDLVFVGLGIYTVIPSLKDFYSQPAGLIIGSMYILFGLLHFFYKTLNYIWAETVTYKLTDNGVEFDFGLFKRITQNIPFETIIEVKSIQEKKPDIKSLIFYSTINSRFKGYDQRQKELRPLPAFDRIPNCEIPLKIIQEKIASNDFSHLQKNLQKDLLKKELGLNQSSDTRKWNRILAFAYLSIASLILYSLIDMHVLKKRYVDDRIESHYNVGGEHFLIQTEKGSRYGVYRIDGGKGSQLKLEKSRLFGIVMLVKTTVGKHTRSTYTFLFYVINFLFTPLAFYFIMVGSVILYNDGRIRLDDRETLYLGPIFVLIIIRFCLYLGGVF